MNRACFPKEKHQNSQKRAKFMNFPFWPFFWLGLPGRLKKKRGNQNGNGNATEFALEKATVAVKCKIGTQDSLWRRR